MKSEIRNRNRLSLARKYEIVMHPINGRSQTEVAKELKIKLSTYRGILKDKLSIIKEFTNNFSNGDLLSLRKTKLFKTSRALFEWFSTIRAENKSAVVSGDLLLQQAKEFALVFNEPCDKIDINWVNRFKRYHSIKWKRFQGEALSVKPEAVRQWHLIANELKNRYDPSNIYNCDETGLFWLLTKQGTLAFKSEKVSGCKAPMNRITILLCCNMVGDKLPFWVIGKAKKPHSFPYNFPNVPIPGMTYR